MMGAFKGVIDKKTGKEVTFEKAVDGLMGRMTREALANRDKIWESRRLKFKEPNSSSSAQSKIEYDGMSDPNNAWSGGTPLPGETSVFNSNPALALLNRKIHGLFGLNTTYRNIPQDLVDVLSDQNLFIYDNWKSALDYNLNVARNTLYNNLKELNNPELSSTDREKLMREIENNKQSISSILSKKLEITKAGGLELWLVNHPGEKMVIGANFRFYKDKNKNRFGLNTPTGYANFEDPYYVAYSMDTPLGKVESTYGNNVLSFMYDPKTKQIVTRMSDEYNFNKKGNESRSDIAKLREVAGTDNDLSNHGSLKYSIDLKPILIGGNKNYLQSFPNITRQNSAIENWFLTLGLKYYENK